MREIPTEVPVDSLDDLRTWPNERLLAARDEATVAERRWQQRRLALDRVIDERGALNGRDAVEWVQCRDKVSAQTARGEVEVARSLESLPALRAAAVEGKLSMEQLVPVVELATPETDAEWARRAQHIAPTELNRMVRKQRVVTPAEMAAREEAKAFRWWRTKDGAGLRLSGEIYDVDAAFVEAVFEHEIETMKPARGQAWAPRGRRGANALVEICRRAKRGAAPKRAWRPASSCTSAPTRSPP